MISSSWESFKCEKNCYEFMVMANELLQHIYLYPVGISVIIQNTLDPIWKMLIELLLFPCPQTISFTKCKNKMMKRYWWLDYFSSKVHSTINTQFYKGKNNNLAWLLQVARMLDNICQLCWRTLYNYCHLLNFHLSSFNCKHAFIFLLLSGPANYEFYDLSRRF